MAKVQKTMVSSSLSEVVDRILDKGIVIDAFVKVSLVGIELLSIEARVVIASVETYLKYAEAIGLTASAARHVPEAPRGHGPAPPPRAARLVASCATLAGRSAAVTAALHEPQQTG